MMTDRSLTKLRCVLYGDRSFDDVKVCTVW